MRPVDFFRAPLIEFDAAEIGEEVFAWNIPNEALVAALQERASEEDRIDLVTGLGKEISLGEDGATVSTDTGEILRADFLLAADGRNSRARENRGDRLRPMGIRPGGHRLQYDP